MMSHHRYLRSSETSSARQDLLPRSLHSVANMVLNFAVLGVFAHSLDGAKLLAITVKGLPASIMSMIVSRWPLARLAIAAHRWSGVPIFYPAGRSAMILPGG